VKGCKKEGKMKWMKVKNQVINRCPMSIVDKSILNLVQIIINSIFLNINCYQEGLLEQPALLVDAMTIVKNEIEKKKMEQANVR